MSHRTPSKTHAHKAGSDTQECSHTTDAESYGSFLWCTGNAMYTKGRESRPRTLGEQVGACVELSCTPRAVQCGACRVHTNSASASRGECVYPWNGPWNGPWATQSTCRCAVHARKEDGYADDACHSRTEKGRRHFRVSLFVHGLYYTGLLRRTAVETPRANASASCVLCLAVHAATARVDDCNGAPVIIAVMH